MRKLTTFVGLMLFLSLFMAAFASAQYRWFDDQNGQGYSMYNVTKVNGFVYAQANNASDVRQKIMFGTDGDTVYIPSGTYDFSGTFIRPNVNINVICEGDKTFLLTNITDADGSAFINFVFNGKHLTMRNCIINQTNPYNGTAIVFGSGIGKGNFLENVRINNFNVAVNLTGTYTSEVRDSFLKNNKYGIVFNSNLNGVYNTWVDVPNITGAVGFYFGPWRGNTVYSSDAENQGSSDIGHLGTGYYFANGSTGNYVIGSWAESIGTYIYFDTTSHHNIFDGIFGYQANPNWIDRNGTNSVLGSNNPTNDIWYKDTANLTINAVTTSYAQLTGMNGNVVTNTMLNAPNDANLTMAMSFNSETSPTTTTYKDLTPSANNATLQNAASQCLTGGFNGKGAVCFSGADNAWLQTDSLSTNMNTTSGTWTFWINSKDNSSTAYTGSGGLIQQRTGTSRMLISLNQNGSQATYGRFNGFSFNQSGTQLSTATSSGCSEITSMNTWYFVAYTITPTQTKFWINGVPCTAGAATLTTPINTNYNNITIFGKDTVNNRRINASIDDVRYYNYALSQNEILSIYNHKTETPSTRDGTTYGNEYHNALSMFYGLTYATRAAAACPAGQFQTYDNISSSICAYPTNATTFTSALLNQSSARFISPITKDASPAIGSMYYNTTNQYPCWYNGSTWLQSNKSVC